MNIKDGAKVILLHYIRKYASGPDAYFNMLDDLVELEKNENFEQCRILLEAIKYYEQISNEEV